MREVDLGPGRALLIKEHGEFSAMGHKCPHYGAPLVKGEEGFLSFLLSNGAERALEMKLTIQRVLTFMDWTYIELNIYCTLWQEFCLRDMFGVRGTEPVSTSQLETSRTSQVWTACPLFR